MNVAVRCLCPPKSGVLSEIREAEAEAEFILEGAQEVLRALEQEAPDKIEEAERVVDEARRVLTSARAKYRHPKGDTITLRDRFGFRQAITIRNVIQMEIEETQADLEEPEIVAILTEQFILMGPESWTVVDATGQPLPPSRANIRDVLLADLEAAVRVGNAADELYRRAVMTPLAAAASKSSPVTLTGSSTSRTTRRSTSPRKRSKPSSISTIPTVATETTSSSLGGASSLSPSSESAA